MASLAKKYDRQKLFGQVYTPDYIVRKILDDVGYKGKSIIGRKILDPACGDGRFLVEIVKRIIENSPVEKLAENLQNVYGWDIDRLAIAQCVSNLNNILKPLGLKPDWNITAADSIQKLERKSLFSTSFEGKFDFIVGNPPYIRIQHLDLPQREYIQKNYTFCKNGSTDIYIAFFELCCNLLSEKGKCGLITPNTFFYTETAKPLRRFMAENQKIVQITNYGDLQLFDDATTYSAITIFANTKQEKFVFEKALTNKKFECKTISTDQLKNHFWQLSTKTLPLNKGKRLGDIANIHVGITTLCDKAYIFPVKDFDKETVIAQTRLIGDVRIERAILKPIIKGSTLKHGSQPITEFVLFPYKKSNGKHVIIPETQLESKYPLAYDYLLSVKDFLMRRDNGKPNAVAWYAFGRSQGLDTSFGKKIIFSPINIKPNFVFYNNPDCTFYSGYCIKYDGDTKELLNRLNSEDMQKFIEASSRDFRGGWKAYNKKIVENFYLKDF